MIQRISRLWCLEAEDTENWYPFCIDPSKLSKEQRMKYLQEIERHVTVHG